MTALRVGVDLDGVLHPFIESIARYLSELGFAADPHTWVGWSGCEAWGITYDEFCAWCDRAADERVLYAQPPYPGAVEAMQQLFEAGVELHLVTARSFGSSPAASVYSTCQWLADWGIPFTSLTFAADKTVVPTDVFVEDNVDNFDALEAAGTTAILISNRYNAAADGRRRVDSFAEAAEQILTSLLEGSASEPR